MSKRSRKGELEASQQTVKFFETVLRASADGIVITDMTQNIIVVNEAFCTLFGRRKREMAETSLFIWLEQLDSDAPRRWAELEKDVRSKGSCRDIEFHKMIKESVTYLSVNASLLERVADEESGVIISIWRDVTDRVLAQKEIEAKNVQLAHTLKELRKTKRQLVEAEKMAALGNLVAGVAHEISTPIGIGITASSSLVDKTKQFADLFKADKMKRSDLQNYLQYAYKTGKLILRNLQRTGDLVQSFKQVSANQASEQRRQFKLKCYLQNVIRSLEPKLEAKSVRIEIDCDEELELNSYPGIFAQIVTNFVINSLIHGFRDENEGQIKITAEIQDDNLYLQYQDNGRGISEDILPKIFDPFFTTDRQVGTGLGMHIVYNIITHKLKGSITCESEAGNGVLFRITTPLSQCSRSQAPRGNSIAGRSVSVEEA